MASFSASGFTAITTTRKTVLAAVQPAAATALGKMHRVHLGSVGTPADVSVEWIIQRQSTLGTGTTVTPTDEDDTGSVATILARSNYTVEPTLVSNTILFDNGINQRSAFTIMLGPGREWRLQVTNNRGVGVGALHASSTVTVNSVVAWDE